MKRAIAPLLLTLSTLAAQPAMAMPTTVTFEDLDRWSIPTDGYGGLSGWSDVGMVFPGYDVGAGIQVFYSFLTSGELRFNHAPVVFHGTYYKSYAADPQVPLTSISLFYLGQLVHSILDPRAPLDLVWVDSGYHGLIDRIVFAGGAEGFAIDNLTYEQASTSVPEPAAGLLLLTGLGLYGVTSRRRQRRNDPAGC